MTKVGAQNKGNWLGMKLGHDKAQAHSQDEWKCVGDEVHWKNLEVHFLFSNHWEKVLGDKILSKSSDL
jgi:hypothetical protein